MALWKNFSIQRVVGSFGFLCELCRSISAFFAVKNLHIFLNVEAKAFNQKVRQERLQSFLVNHSETIQPAAHQNAFSGFQLA